MHLLESLPERLQRKITVSENGCWLWFPVRKDGYTLAYWEGTRPLGHRLVWELLVGPIGEGMQLDHVKELCESKNCVNPAHLEEVTPLKTLDGLEETTPRLIVPKDMNTPQRIPTFAKTDSIESARFVLSLAIESGGHATDLDESLP